jgi:homogentisate 1,2-dioxygenase
LGLYAEQLSGSAFTAPRPSLKRTWVYRTLPGVKHTPFEKADNGMLFRGSFDGLEVTPQQFRWQPMDREAFLAGKEVDFVQGFLSIDRI